MALVSAVRGQVGERLRRWGLDEVADDVALVLSELLTNAVLHAGGATSCRLSVTGGMLEVAVADDDPRSPAALRSAEDAEPGLLASPVDGDRPEHDGPAPAIGPDLAEHYGRGLLIVASLAEHWGVIADATGGGKSVWCSLSAPAAAWNPLAPCPCPGPSVGRSPSGLPLVHQSGAWDE